MDQQSTPGVVEWSGEANGPVYVDAMKVGFNRHTLKIDLGLEQSGSGVQRQVSVLMNPRFARELVVMLTGALAVYADTYAARPPAAAPPAPDPVPGGGREKQP